MLLQPQVLEVTSQKLLDQSDSKLLSRTVYCAEIAPRVLVAWTGRYKKRVDADSSSVALLSPQVLLQILSGHYSSCGLDAFGLSIRKDEDLAVARIAVRMRSSSICASPEIASRGTYM